MSKIICMASPKGGSGKTVLTATFATFLNALGKKVLIVDTDASTNGLTLMYLKEVMLQSEHAISENRKPIGTYELVKDNLEPEIVELSTGVHIIPATYSFINTEEVTLPTFTGSLKSILKSVQEKYDYIFLDAQAGSDNYSHITMKKDISNEVVIVSEYDPLSAAGVERLKALFREDLTYNRTWVLLNKMLPDFVQSFSDFLEVAKYLSPIPWDAEVVKAYARRKLALDLEYGNEFTLAITQTLKSLLGDAIAKELETWTQQKAALIREPIEIQYIDMRKRLDSLRALKYRLETHQKKKSHLFMLITSISLFAVMLTFAYFFFHDNKATIFESLSPIVITILSLMFIVTTFDSFKHYFKNRKYTYTDDNLIKEIDVLNDKLNKLEALRNAELSTLIKSKNNIPKSTIS
jgi:MinD-like ATPase involved in chromosome partitioning or flagellar assembly